MSWAEVKKLNSDLSTPLNIAALINHIDMIGSSYTGNPSEAVELMKANALYSHDTAKNVVFGLLETGGATATAMAEYCETKLSASTGVGEWLAFLADSDNATLKACADMTAVVASSTAMTAVLASNIAMTAVFASETAFTAVVNSSTAMTTIAENEAFMKILVTSNDSMTKMANSSIALTAIIASSTAPAIFMSNPSWSQTLLARNAIYSLGTLFGNAEWITDKTILQGNGGNYPARWETVFDFTKIKKVHFKGCKTGGTLNLSVLVSSAVFEVSYTTVPTNIFTAYSLDTSAITGNQTMKFRMGYSDGTGGTGGYTQYKDIYFELV